MPIFSLVRLFLEISITLRENIPLDKKRLKNPDTAHTNQKLSLFLLKVYVPYACARVCMWVCVCVWCVCVCGTFSHCFEDLCLVFEDLSESRENE